MAAPVSYCILTDTMPIMNIQNEIETNEDELERKQQNDQFISSQNDPLDAGETDGSQELDVTFTESQISSAASTSCSQLSSPKKEEGIEYESQDDKLSATKKDEEIPTSLAYSYHFDGQYNVPARLAGCWSEFQDEENFTKGCKWSPDGLCILTNSNDNCLRLFNLPEQFYSTPDEPNNTLSEMIPVLKMTEGESVYDFCWYPLMTSLDPVTCCFVTTSRQNPIHMWDAFTGELRCSYRAYDHMDEMVAATSIAFNLRGEKLFCGFNNTIRIFDVHKPGRCFEQRSTKANRQLGIISCFAFNPSDDEMYAAGSYLKSIGIYSEPKGEVIFRLEGQQGGVTHLMFSQDGSRLYSGGRKDPEILCWDLRFPGTTLFTLQRVVLTHQRIYYDIDKSETFLVSGNDDGCLSVWNIAGISDKNDVLEPILNYQLQDDCINGVSFNPLLPIIATTSGQRKIPVPTEDDESENMFTKIMNRDNSLQLWWAGKSTN